MRGQGANFIVIMGCYLSIYDLNRLGLLLYYDICKSISRGLSERINFVRLIKE